MCNMKFIYIVRAHSVNAEIDGRDALRGGAVLLHNNDAINNVVNSALFTVLTVTVCFTRSQFDARLKFHNISNGKYWLFCYYVC